MLNNGNMIDLVCEFFGNSNHKKIWNKNTLLIKINGMVLYIFNVCFLIILTNQFTFVKK